MKMDSEFQDVSKRECGVLHRPLLCGWKRDYEWSDLNSDKVVPKSSFYIAPCGRKFTESEMNDLSIILFRTGSELRMENFSFDPKIILIKPLSPSKNLEKIFGQVRKVQTIMIKNAKKKKDKIAKLPQNQGRILK